MDNHQLQFDHRFAKLATYGESNPFYVAMQAEGVAKKPRLLAYNPEIARMIGLSSHAVESNEFTNIFSGNSPLSGSQPLAMAYSGHQFGHWAGQLGDGRALLLTQIRNQENQLWDIQLKGSGLTPFSRMGDGRAVLRSCVREYLASIALHGLAIPTTHALCIVGSGSNVQRERLEPGAILTRIARSHLRFGHFEHFTHHDMQDHLQTLVQHMLNEYFDGMPPITYFAEITRRTAHLIADWQAFGFAHGVMNTDNMSAIGLTIDYGPYGFLDQFDLGHICNHSDTSGRYRFDRQPEIAQWNLWAFAHALAPIIPLEQAEEILQDYLSQFMARYHQNMMRRLGLPHQASKAEFWQKYLLLLQKARIDYTLSFWQLYSAIENNQPEGEIFQQVESQAWWTEYQGLIEQNGGKIKILSHMAEANPRYILRNWLAENTIKALEKGDDAPLKRLSKVLKNPFQEHPNCADLQQPPPKEMQGLSVSCSS